MSNTKTIARNSGWFGLENAINFGINLFTSIAIARSLGPSKMGHVIYVTWVASVLGGLGGLGIPATTRKYMAEFLGRGERGIARYIYLRTLLLQGTMATLVTGGVIAWVLSDSQREYRFPLALIALSVWPMMVNSISALANVAREEMSANLPGTMISMVVFFLGIAGTVAFKWGVLGVGGSMFIMRLTDFVVRFVPTFRRINGWESTRTIPEGLQRRMVAFAWRSVVTLLLALIVWERSEFFLLKNLCSDIRQVAFYSLAFSMADRLLLPSMVFSAATGATIYAQYGRDKSRIAEIAASAVRYLALTAIPLHVIFAALAMPALLLLYGRQYTDAAAVVTLAPVLCMPKAFIYLVQDLLQSFERQIYVIATTILAGVADIGIAWWLVRSHGAVGACIGSGVAQFAALGILWGIAIRLYNIRLPWPLIGKMAAFSGLAAITIRLTVARLPSLWALLGGLVAAFILYVVFLYTTRVLEGQDRERIVLLTDRLPSSMARTIRFILSKMIRNDCSDAKPVSA